MERDDDDTAQKTERSSGDKNASSPSLLASPPLLSPPYASSPPSALPTTHPQIIIIAGGFAKKTGSENRDTASDQEDHNGTNRAQNKATNKAKNKVSRSHLKKPSATAFQKEHIKALGWERLSELVLEYSAHDDLQRCRLHCELARLHLTHDDAQKVVLKVLRSSVRGLNAELCKRTFPSSEQVPRWHRELKWLFSEFSQLTAPSQAADSLRLLFSLYRALCEHPGHPARSQAAIICREWILWSHQQNTGSIKPSEVAKLFLSLPSYGYRDVAFLEKLCEQWDRHGFTMMRRELNKGLRELTEGLCPMADGSRSGSAKAFALNKGIDESQIRRLLLAVNFFERGGQKFLDRELPRHSRLSLEILLRICEDLLHLGLTHHIETCLTYHPKPRPTLTHRRWYEFYAYVLRYHLGKPDRARDLLMEFMLHQPSITSITMYLSPNLSISYSAQPARHKHKKPTIQCALRGESCGLAQHVHIPGHQRDEYCRELRGIYGLIIHTFQLTPAVRICYGRKYNDGPWLLGELIKARHLTKKNSPLVDLCDELFDKMNRDRRWVFDLAPSCHLYLLRQQIASALTASSMPLQKVLSWVEFYQRYDSLLHSAALRRPFLLSEMNDPEHHLTPTSQSFSEFFRPYQDRWHEVRHYYGVRSSINY